MVIGNIPSPAKVSKTGTSIDMFAKVSQSTAGTAFQDMMNMSAGKAGNVQSDTIFQSGKSDSDVKDVMGMESKVDNILNDSKLQSQMDKSVQAEELEALEKEIAAAVKDALGLTDEELEQILAENGFTLLDLIIPQNLTVLVTEVMADGDAMKLLTDGNVSDTLAQLNQEIQSLVSAAADDLSMSVDELCAAIEELGASNDEEDSANQLNAKDNLNAEAMNEGNQLEDNITITTDKSANEDGQTSQNGEGLSSQFVQTLTQNVEGQIAVDEVFEGYQTNAEDVIRQLIDSIKVNVTQDTSSMELQLYPEHLGKIQVTVASKDGIITAQLAAQNEAVKAIIESQLVSLKTTMNEQGLKVEAVEVTIASHGFEDGRNFEGSNKGQSNKDNQNKVRHINFEIPDEELTDTEQLAKQMMQANGGSVDYTA